MDRATEIASDFTVGDYEVLRARLDPQNPDTEDWRKVLSAFQRRIRERFLKPIADLARNDKCDVLPTRPGFAILALDCLLIDTIQSFREGRVSTGEISPAASFKAFLRSPWFANFKADDRSEFFHYVRNGLLHNGETRGDWKVRIDSPSMLVKDRAPKTRTINRRLFHAGVLREFRTLCRELSVGPPENRIKFLRRMDAICGVLVDPLNNLYFAYGSNLLQSEIRRDAPEAEPVGIAFLPGYRLVFTKHSTTRNGDAASIEPNSARMVWGFVYRMHARDRQCLREREKGYSEVPMPVFLKSPGDQDICPLDAFTFIGDRVCPKKCGLSTEYLSLIIKGAKERLLPPDYIEELRTHEAARQSQP